MTQEEKDLLDCWRLRIRIAQRAHFQYAGVLRRRHLQFGLPVVVLTTVVGTSVFSSLTLDPSTTVKIIVGLVSLCTAILASLQTFLDFSGQSEKHRMAATRFSALKKSIEQEITFPSEGSKSLHDFVVKIREEWNAINSDYPLPPGNLYQKVFDELNGSKCFKETA